MADVWVLGSLNVDVVVRVQRHPAPGETVLAGDAEQRFGGKGANQAVAAAVAGATVHLVGRVGADADGSAYRARLDAFGIDVAGVHDDADAATGRALIAVDPAGENTIIVSPGVNARVGDDELAALDGMRAGDVLLLQLEIGLDVVAEAAERAAAAGVRIVLNAAPFAPLAPSVLALADPVVANESEAAALTASGAEPPELLVTLGAEGSRWGEVAVPADAVEHVVDTTGAGDTYCGVLAAALAGGSARGAAMRAAAAAAAASVTRAGAQPDAPA